MTPQMQRVSHQPSIGQYGDCFRTAIAAMLDLDAEAVPHVFGTAERCQGSGEEGFAEIDAWLRARGQSLVWIPFSGEAKLRDVLALMKAHNPTTPFGICGQSKPGLQHYVVGLGEEIVCDPSGRGAPHLIAPCSDGLWWVTFIGAALNHELPAAPALNAESASAAAASKNPSKEKR